MSSNDILVESYKSEFIEFRHGDGVSGMASIRSETVKCVLIDPPYLYLKGQKLERTFDARRCFIEYKRILKDDGFVVMFGRGETFYRWNTILADLGFKFKEEIIWDKCYTTSSMHPISRHHETISIFTKKDGKINKVKIPYENARDGDWLSISRDLKRISSGLNSPKELNAINEYVNNKTIAYGEDKKRGYNTTIQGVSKEQIRSVKSVQALFEGMSEKSIIRIGRDHYSTIHPTQKPIELIKRLLHLTTYVGDLVIDTFAGSASCGEACAELERNWIGWEIDQEYFDDAVNKRLKKMSKQTKLL